MERAYIQDDVVVLFKNYRKRLGLSDFLEAVNSLPVVNSGTQTTNTQPTNNRQNQAL